ncbi:MAG: hypothetical protein ACYCS4_07850 [Acidimicrobiales bacterium]
MTIAIDRHVDRLTLSRVGFVSEYEDGYLIRCRNGSAVILLPDDGGVAIGAHGASGAIAEATVGVASIDARIANIATALALAVASK